MLVQDLVLSLLPLLTMEKALCWDGWATWVSGETPRSEVDFV